jgi:tetratricopeptide (TPR) repeat protein
MSHVSEVFLGFRLRIPVLATLVALLSSVSLGADTAKVSLDANETLFTVLSAINSCGYDQELASSDALRSQVKAELAKAIQDSQEATDASNEVCRFYQEHQQQDPSKELSQYISLALYLEGPPTFTPKAKEAEMPPDAVHVLGLAPLLQAFYVKTGLHTIWTRHKEQYDALIARFHDPLAKMMFDTDIYLKLPSAGYLGRQFIVYIEAMGAPSETNARVYGTDYYVVISPAGSALKMEQLRHTYLHYVLDPMSMKRPEAMKRLQPLLETVTGAPMDDSFKNDISLLVTECLIRAIETRTGNFAKTPEPEREQAIERWNKQGFILTRYFYDALAKFEKDPVGFRDGYGDILNGIDVGREGRRAQSIEFASQASPEVVAMPRRAPNQLLLNAEKRLSAGDADGAQKLAEQALEEKKEDPGRALFILAQVATANRDMKGAREYFERAIGVAKEPKVVAWSHIYLGRIFDLQEDRDSALGQYKAALDSSSSVPEAKAAAQRGIQTPYQPPRGQSQPDQENQ